MASATPKISRKKATHKVSAAAGAAKGQDHVGPSPADRAAPKRLKQASFGWLGDAPDAPALGKKAEAAGKAKAKTRAKAAAKKKGTSKVLRELPAKAGMPKAQVLRGAPRPEDDGMPAYLVAFRGLMGSHDLALWIARYLKDEVAGIQAANTLEGKVRDFRAFVQWMVHATGQATLAEWLPRDTQSYVRHLMGQRRAPATVNRHLATLRRFARWAQDQPGGLLQRHGSPMRGIKDVTTDEPECKKLDATDIHRVFRAADRLVDLAGRANARPRRNRAILSVLYHTGLRVSELCALRMDQLRGKHLLNVRRKGRTITKKIYLVADCLDALHDYLTHEWHLDAPAGPKDEQGLFLGGPGRALGRGHVGIILREIAAEASKKLKEPIELHPHRLRHTFGALYREKSGSDTETAAALGHTGLAHVSRYVRKSQKEREDAMEKIFEV